MRCLAQSRLHTSDVIPIHLQVTLQRYLLVAKLHECRNIFWYPLFPGLQGYVYDKNPLIILSCSRLEYTRISNSYPKKLPYHPHLSDLSNLKLHLFVAC